MKSITLNIGGEDRVFYFGLGFLGNLLEAENIEFTEIDEKIKQNPFKWIPLIMYYSCAYGFKRKGEFPLFDIADVSDWVDEVGINSEVVTSFFTGFRESLVKDVPEQKEVKKKVAKK